MAVNHLTTWQVKPGSLPEVVARMGAAKKIHERLGGKVRAWQLTTAGVNVGRVAYALRFADYPALASFAKKAAADAEWLKMQSQQVDGASLFSQGISSELPGLEYSPLAAGGGPRVRAVRLWQVEKGRSQEAVALLAELKPHVQRLGGRLSAVQLVFVGPAAGQLANASEFADLKAWAAFQHKSATDTAFQAVIQTRVLSAGSPLTLLSATLLTEIAI